MGSDNELLSWPLSWEVLATGFGSERFPDAGVGTGRLGPKQALSHEICSGVNGAAIVWKQSHFSLSANDLSCHCQLLF